MLPLGQRAGRRSVALHFRLLGIGPCSIELSRVTAGYRREVIREKNSIGFS